MIKDEADYTSFGNPFPVDKTAQNESQEMKDYLFCDHNQTKVDAFISELDQEYYKAYGITPNEPGVPESLLKKNLGKVATTLISIFGTICGIFLCLLIRECGYNAYLKMTGRQPKTSSNLQIENGLPSFELGNIIERYNNQQQNAN